MIGVEQVGQVIINALESRPQGATHWSRARTARHSGQSASTIGRIWRAFGLQAHRTEGFRPPNAPLITGKVYDIVGPAPRAARGGCCAWMTSPRPRPVPSRPCPWPSAGSRRTWRSGPSSALPTVRARPLGADILPRIDGALAALDDGDLDLVIVPAVVPLTRYRHRVIGSEPVVPTDPGTPADGCGTGTPAAGVTVDDVSRRTLSLVPDTCRLTTFTRDLLSDRELPLDAYSGEASGYRELEDWTAMGPGGALLPRSRVVATRSCPGPSPTPLAGRSLSAMRPPGTAPALRRRAGDPGGGAGGDADRLSPDPRVAATTP